MTKSDSLFLTIVCVFTVAFVAALLTQGKVIWPLYATVAGIILFLVRIFRGDD